MLLLTVNIDLYLMYVYIYRLVWRQLVRSEFGKWKNRLHERTNESGGRRSHNHRSSDVEPEYQPKDHLWNGNIYIYISLLFSNAYYSLQVVRAVLRAFFLPHSQNFNIRDRSRFFPSPSLLLNTVLPKKFHIRTPMISNYVRIFANLGLRMLDVLVVDFSISTIVPTIFT